MVQGVSQSEATGAWPVPWESLIRACCSGPRAPEPTGGHTNPGALARTRPPLTLACCPADVEDQPLQPGGAVGHVALTA